MTATLPVLYSFRRCPYAMRARMAILASGERCLLREVVLRDKPPEMLTASPKGTVPVLVLPNGQVIDESYDIMKWALARSDPEGWLAPLEDRIQDIDALVRENDEEFKHHLDRYKYANRTDDDDPREHRAHGMRFLQKLEARLSRSAFLFGTRVSLADIAIAPFVRQFAHTDTDWFEAQNIPRVQAWLAGILGSPLFQSVMKKYAPWKKGYMGVFFP